ncbi:MAG: hypothetical protein ACR2FO_09755 [Actinomycetota bacterium]
MPAADPSQRPRPLMLAAALIAVGSVCFGVKASAILLTGDQPPILFGIAGLPIGLGLLLLARWSITRHGPARRVTAAAALSFVAVLAAAYGASMEILSQTIAEPFESMLAVGSGFGPMIAALLIGLRLRAFPGNTRRIGRRALLIAIAFIPLMVLGGIAADLVGERYLEIGLLVVAGLWLSLAQSMWTVNERV